jgi:hypothetical protein
MKLPLIGCRGRSGGVFSVVCYRSAKLSLAFSTHRPIDEWISRARLRSWISCCGFGKMSSPILLHIRLSIRPRANLSSRLRDCQR